MRKRLKFKDWIIPISAAFLLGAGTMLAGLWNLARLDDKEDQAAKSKKDLQTERQLILETHEVVIWLADNEMKKESRLRSKTP